MQRKAKAEREKRRQGSVQKLQSVYRGHLARRYVLLRHLAAAKVQGLGRGWHTRRRLFAEKKLRNTIKIQRWFRACLARDLMMRMRREGGALLLQRVFRGHLGRVLFNRNKLNEGEHYRNSVNAFFDKLLFSHPSKYAFKLFQSKHSSYFCNAVCSKRGWEEV
jgi:hypothetical protein